MSNTKVLTNQIASRTEDKPHMFCIYGYKPKVLTEKKERGASNSLP